MRTKPNLILINIFVITLALAFSTIMYLSHLESEAYRLSHATQETAIKTFWQLLLAKGSNFRINDNKLLAGDYSINDNHELPDKIKDLFGGTATIFMGDTRVTTNVLKADGSRAIGTKLTGPVYDAIFNKHSSYRGEAPILGIAYYTAYDPIKDQNGNIIGVLYVGVKKSEFLATYSKLKINFIIGTVALEILLITLVWGMLRERQRAEDRIRGIADKNRLITDSIPTAIAYIDAELHYQFANRRYYELFGGELKDLVGKTVREVLDETLLASRQENFNHALAGNEVVFANRIPGKDGGEICLQTSFIPHKENSGKVIGFFIQHHDITDLTLTQEALQTTSEQYRTLFDTTGAITFVVEEDTTVALVNDEFVRHFGIMREAVEGQLSWTAFVTPKSKEQMLEYHRARRINPTSAPHSYECESVCCDGSIHNMIAHVNLIPGTGRSVVSFHDITCHKQLEANLQKQLSFLQTLIDTIPSPVFYKDREGRYTGCNLAFSKYLGSTREDLVGKTVYDLAPVELADRYHEMDEELFANPGVQIYDASVIYADGSRHEVAFNKATFSSTDNQVEGLVGVILDLTERKKAEDILAEKEEFLSNIFDSIQDGINILDEELRVVRVNPVIERRFSGRMPIVGRKCHEAFHGRTEPCEQCPSLETLRNGQPSFKIFSAVDNETEIWLELHTFPLFDSKKSRIMGVIEFTRDVTERKRTDDALIAAEKQFRCLVEQSLVGTYIIQDSRFVYVNPKMADIFGYSQEELISGITHLELTVVEDRELAAENVRKRTTGELQSIHYGFRGLRKDGKKIYVEVYGTGTQYNGRPAIIGTLLDVTARESAEEALRESEDRSHRIFSQNDDAVILFRIDDFAIIDANPAAEKLTGYSLPELRGLTPSTFVDPEDFRRLIDKIPMEDHSQAFQLNRATGTRKDGSTLIVAIRAKILRLGDECIVHGSIRDSTEKERLEEEIRGVQAKLIHANKMTSIGMLASSVAHEINNPNNCISVNAAMMADVWQDAEPLLKAISEEQGEFMLRGIPFTKMKEFAPRLLDGIREGSRRITTIVQNMRDYVKEDKSGCHGSIDINQLLQNSIAILWHHIHIHTDNFTTAPGEWLPPARGNGQQVEQVLINLITNSLQALPDKKSGVYVTTGMEKGESIIITVRDEGIGMDEATLARLTEPFFTTRTDDGGTGLGLYISASIIKDHGGTLKFESEPGKGTTATVRLSVAEKSSQTGEKTMVAS